MSDNISFSKMKEVLMKNKGDVERLFNVGTIHCCSGDKTTPEFDIKDIKNPSEVKEILSKNIEIQRDKKRIAGREFLVDSEDDIEE